MPFIDDEPQSFAARRPPPQTQVSYQTSSAAVLPAGHAISTATTCSCVRDVNGVPLHVCTAASYVPQVVVAPQHDPAAQSAALHGIGGQFDRN